MIPRIHLAIMALMLVLLQYNNVIISSSWLQSPSSSTRPNDDQTTQRDFSSRQQRRRQSATSDIHRSPPKEQRQLYYVYDPYDDDLDYPLHYYQPSTESSHNQAVQRSTNARHTFSKALGILLLIIIALLICVFAPICYPLTLWDLISVYFHWEECQSPTGSSEYMNACDVVVC